MQKCRLATVLALLAMLILPVPYGAALAGASLPEGYAPVASSPEWTLYLREDNLGLIMQDNRTGGFMASTVADAGSFRDNELWKGFYQSGIVLEYIQGNINKYPWANLVSTPNTKNFTYFENGFICEVYYPELGIGYSVIITLDGNDVCIYIPQSAIREEKSEEYCVGALYVYPFMGYSKMGGNGGYILIPDGQGALVRLEDNEGRYTAPYTTSVYGTNIGLVQLTSGAVLNNYSTNNPVERTIMPVFGVIHDKTAIGCLGVLEEGDISAEIMAYFNGVGNMSFDWIGAKYTYRVVYAQSTGPSSGTLNMRTQRPKRFDIKQHFYFVSGGDAGYTGLALQYRGYLRRTGAFAGADTQSVFDIQVDFLGGERENGLIGTVPVTMTTAAQAAAILEKLDAAGVRVTSVFRGWQKNGLIGGQPTTGYTPAGNLGGKSGFDKLFKAADGMGNRLYLEADLATLIPDTAGALIYSALKKVDSNTFAKPLYGWVYDSMQYLIPAKSLDLARTVSSQLVQGGVPGACLAGITELVTDYMHRRVYYDSSDCANYYSLCAETFSLSMPLLLDHSNAYLWKYGNALAGMPIGGSDYVYTDREVPFLSIALSGCIPVYAEYVNFQANIKEFFLSLVEQGLRPSFLVSWEDPIKLQKTNANYIYSSKFSLYEDLIAKWNKELTALHAMIGGNAISGHVRTGSLTTVTYENGLTVYINYSRTEMSVAGFTLPALSYKAVP